MPTPPPSRLDANQVLQGSFDEDRGRLRVDSDATVVNADIDVALDATEDNVAAWVKDENGNPFTDANYVPVGQTTHDNLNLNANVQVENIDVSATNPLPSIPYGQLPNGSLIKDVASGVSTLNSITSPLGANDTFTGTWELVEGYSTITALAKVDASSITDGGKFQWSHDGITVDRETSSTIPASSNGLYFASPVQGRYFRLVYVNGPVAQTSAVIQVRFSEYFTGPNVLPVLSSIKEDTAVLMTRAISVAKDPNGAYVNESATGTSTANSTSTPLGAGATFTGTFQNVENYASVTILIKTDVMSAVDGGRFQWSTDGVTVDRETASTVPPSTNGYYFSAPTQAKYFRFVYTNGATPQGLFIAQIKYSDTLTGPNTVPIIATIKDDTSIMLTRSVQVAKDPNGTYVNERSTGTSTANSSISLIAGGGTFTGAWEDVGGYTNLSITIRADQDSATDGLALEYSTDGVLVDAADYYTITGSSIGVQYTVGIAAKYFRVRYTNGPTPTSVFRLQVVYHTTAPKPSSIRVEDAITGENDAELQKAVITGKTPDGLYANSQTQGIDSSNTSNTPLNASATYRGNWFKWSEGFVTLVSDVKSDVAGTLYIDAATVDNPVDGVDTDIAFSIDVPYNPIVVPVVRRNTPLQSKWYRHRYINGSAGQSVFNISAILTTADPGSTYFPVGIMPTNNIFASQTRAIQTIPNAAGDGFQNTPVDSITGNPKVTVSDLRDDVLLRPLSTPLATQITVGTTATRIDPTQLTNRRAVLISNDGTTNCSIGFSNALTFDSASFRLPAGETRSLMFSEAVQLWAIAQNSGGVQSTLQRSPASATGTATNPSNALTSNNIYANITAAAQTVDVTGFTAGTVNSLVSVRLGCEANRTAGGTQVIAHVATVTGNAGNVGTVSTSASVTAVSNQLYLAAISRESTATVTGVSGLGLGWTQVGTITNGSARTIDVWKAIGTVTSSGIVTASFSAAATNSHIAVSRYSGVDTTTPIQASNTATGSSTTPITAALASTANGMAYMAVAMDNHTSTAGAGYTEISDEVTAAGGNRDGLTTEIKAVTVTGTETPTCTLDSSAAWAALGLTMTPAAVADPTVTLSYTLSAVPGATSGVLTISSTSDTTQYVDITSDRAWVVADIANIAAIATGTSVTATVNVDWIFVELVDTTGNTTRLSVLQGAEAVV